MLNGDDMRRHPRVKHIYLASYDIYGSLGEVAESYIGRTLDVSPGGVRLETAKPLPLLSRLSLSLAIGEKIIEVEGEVVNLSKKKSGMIETGLEFINITPEKSKLLHELFAG